MSRAVSYENSKYPQMPYDLIKEMFVALGIMGVLVLLLAAVFSTPDVPALTAKQVVQQAPGLLVQTALEDLSQQDPISTYGPPYSNTPGAAQSLGPISPQTWMGVQTPVNSAQVEVIQPLEKAAKVNPALNQPLSIWSQANLKQQTAWVSNVQKALKQANIVNSQLVLPAAQSPSYGPVPQLINGYLALAQSGMLEPAIDATNGPVPATNRTDSLLLLQDESLADGQYADKLNMTGDEWGIIKETGNYPGAVWLWFYTLLYHIPPFSNSDSADLWVVLTVTIVTLILVLTPFIPGLRDIPRGVKVYRLIWRWHYREQRRNQVNKS